MNLVALWLQAGLVSVVVLCATTISLPNPRVVAPEVSKSEPCAAPEYRQLDFWIGDWDAFDIGGPTTPSARVRVDRILDGCVLHEQYEDNTGHKGQSFSIYDASREVWHQSWVTNRGELLVIEGRFTSGAMILSGSDRAITGQVRQVRGSWKPVAGGVRESAVRSIDGGRTWKPWFDIMFQPHKP